MFGLAAACAALASCGGGGGGGTTSATVSNLTLTPSPAQVVQVLGSDVEIRIRATINPEPVGNQFYAFILADKPVVQTGAVQLIANADDSATIVLRTDRNLAPGTYEGQLTMRLCRDLQCADEVRLSGNVLPYSIKVLPRLQLTVTGVIQSNWQGAPDSYLVNPGATVVVTSNVPVTWSQGSSIAGSNVQVTSSTTTRWEGTVNGNFGGFVGLVANSIDKPGTASGQAIFNFPSPP
jgi:hypothetical protein